MSYLLNRATEQTQSEWQELPEGLWRFIVGTPIVRLSEQYGKYQVRSPLQLTMAEADRLEQEYGKPPIGVQQSMRTFYTTGLSLGYVKDGQYVTTKLIDFLAACWGHGNSAKFRKWIAAGGGPPRPADKDDQEAELDCIREWLRWWEGLHVYGTITHRVGQGGKVWANFGGPLAIGSLPGMKDDDYVAEGRGKLRAMIAEMEAAAPRESKPKEAKTYEQVFGDGTEDLAF